MAFPLLPLASQKPQGLSLVFTEALRVVLASTWTSILAMAWTNKQTTNQSRTAVLSISSSKIGTNCVAQVERFSVPFNKVKDSTSSVLWFSICLEKLSRVAKHDVTITQLSSAQTWTCPGTLSTQLLPHRDTCSLSASPQHVMAMMTRQNSWTSPDINPREAQFNITQCFYRTPHTFSFCLANIGIHLPENTTMPVSGAISYYPVLDSDG